MALRIKHVELKEANAFVAKLHRHHKPVIGHRYSIGVQSMPKCEGGKWMASSFLCGVAIVGRPVARGNNPQTILEVTRLCTDGTKNACSFLYSAAARAGKELGYEKIGTYILESESGKSLEAAGWTRGHRTAGGQWTGTNGKPRRTDQPTCPKIYWFRELNTPILDLSD